MNIAMAMLLAALSNFGRKVWGQDLVDKAVEEVIIYCLTKYVSWTHTTADDEFLEYVKKKLGRASEKVPEGLF